MLTTYTSEPVSVAVIDYVRGTTAYQQVACSEEFTIRHNPDGSSTVSMPLRIEAYAMSEDGTKGEQLTHATRRDVLVSEMSRAVDAETGQMRYRQLTSTTALNYATGEVEQLPLLGNGLGDWLGYLEAKPEQLALQPFFLRKLFDQVLRPFCEQYIQMADETPSRFA